MKVTENWKEKKKKEKKTIFFFGHIVEDHNVVSLHIAEVVKVLLGMSHTCLSLTDACPLLLQHQKQSQFSRS